ncbi:bifunctional arginine demethylase and lysyl-hydroxylase JMJD6-B-like [Pollicipes pollicipes]|uniref:bifunctional arginine demethylase and lysyl-hydroxylase JMJD6-B-like n=1 Tax=Pollicipes pollicipes TaxID=41117 RepID=UPI0018853F57|nr:bifunctional arginine demethylase and lysyl-hydroxylase JMJD6-B-like [Pollicipes pollicipes]
MTRTEPDGKELGGRVAAILARCRQLHVEPAQLRSLSGYDRLQRAASGKQPRWQPWLLPGLLAILLAVFVHQELYTVQGLSRLILWVEGLDVENEPCMIEMHPIMADLTATPNNCSRCSDVLDVDRVSNITPQEFELKYAYSGRPVIITDGTANWTAPAVFNFQFFKELYAESSGRLAADSTERGCQFFPYKTDFDGLSDVFSMSAARANMQKGEEPWYIGWSSCDSAAGNELRRHYTRPYFLPETAELSRLDWIFMGTPGFGAHLHIDHVKHPSWQAQLHGRKMWTLEPPRECLSVCRSMDVTVNQGEIIVLDTNMWYHMTQIVSDEISITIGSDYD